VNTDEFQPKVNPWLITLAVMLPTFMEVLDTTIANVSLSHIAGSLSVSTDEATWVLTSYLISNAIVIPSTAWFGQRFSRKRFLMTCVIIFTAASFLSGLATSLPMLLLMQVIMGAGGGAMQPIAQTVLFESFPKEKQGQAMAVYVMGIVLAPILGPVVGGWITDNYSWRWVFFINIPVGIVAVMLIKQFLHDPPWIRNARPPRLDMIGFGFMSLWLGCQEVLLDKGQEEDWFGSHFIILMAVLAVIGLVVFLVRELTVKTPFVDLHVLKNYNFSLGVFLMFLAGVALYGVTVIIPLFLQSLMGYTALLSGYSMAPRGLGSFVAIPLAGRLVGKIQGRYLVAGGFLVYGAAALFLAHISLAVSPWALFWPVFFTGVGSGFIFVPLNTLAFGALKREELGNASGIFNLMRNAGASVGISLVTTLNERHAQLHQSTLVANLTPYDSAYQSSLQTMATTFGAYGDPVTAQQQAVGSLYNTVLTQANLLAYLDNFRFFALVSLIGLVGTLLFKNVKKAKDASQMAAH
jgi:MFS transporter, DHA2 family, multidrug resistance protein